jgi:hypothetical protein
MKALKTALATTLLPFCGLAAAFPDKPSALGSQRWRLCAAARQ